MPIPRIVLTGGPCAGKTSALARLSARLQTYGLRVYTTAEASTIMLAGGARVLGTTPLQQLIYQRGVLQITIAIENSLLGFARSLDEKAVLICDRGAMDGLAYIGPARWAILVGELNLGTAELLEGRYDAVLHLVTAADGAESFYGNENNPGRYEDAEGARAVDRRLREAWSAHPKHTIIDNSTDFDEKMRRVVRVVCAEVGIPGPGRWERKYLARPGPDLPAPVQTLDLEQTYLLSNDGSEARVRKCEVGGVTTFTFATKKDADGGRRVEIEEAISEHQYAKQLLQADPGCRPIRKRRSVYSHEGRFFLLDRFMTPEVNYSLVEVEVEDASEVVELPAFLGVEKEVTGYRAYHNASLARR